MRKIKLMLSVLTVLSLVIGVCFLINKEEYSYYLAIGDYVSNDVVIDDVLIEGFANKVGDSLKVNKIVNEFNLGYIKNNVTSKKLLEMIEKDSYLKKEDGLVSLIKKSKYITITLGFNDLLNYIKYDSNKDKLIYDKEIISNKIEVFKHNYYKIVEEIKDINENAKVILVGCYCIYGDNDLEGLINKNIKEVAIETNQHYVDVSKIKDKCMYMENELYLTNKGQEKIYQLVINYINEIDKI